MTAARWGNPFTVEDILAEGTVQTTGEARAVAVHRFCRWLDGVGPDEHELRRGRTVSRSWMLEHLEALASADRTDNDPIQHDELLSAVLDAIDDDQELDATTREAARSLFFDPIRLSTLEWARYAEGRHRSQAMLDAGVRWTVIVPAPHDDGQT